MRPNMLATAASRGVSFVLALIAAGPASSIAQAPAIPATIVLDGRALALAKQQIQQRDPAKNAALQTLVSYAGKEMDAGPYTVTAKSKVPPSGDKRDYLSQGRYFWPDPSKPNGLPYLRKDGETNPDSRGFDEEPLNDMVSGVRTLALAYYYTGDERYADRAALFLRTWFIDPDRRMNPRLLYGQSWPGKSEGRSEGILDTRCLLDVVDAMALLDGSTNLLATDRNGIKAWFRDYATWLRTSQFGHEEGAGPNNHGTWYDAQLAGFSIFVGDLTTARRVLEAAKSVRCTNAIEPDGRQPYELARVDAFGYSLLNLDALTTLAAVGRSVNIDLWNFRSSDGRGLRAAADFLVPFISGQQRWTFGKKPVAGHNDALISLYRNLANGYGDERYELVASGLPEFADPKFAVELQLIRPRIAGAQFPGAPIGKLARGDFRNPPPSGASLADAVKRVEAKFASDLRSAQPSAGREPLVRRLATEAAAEGHDPTERFALLTVARQQSLSPLDPPLLLSVLITIGRDYRIDELQEYLTELNKAEQAAVRGESADAIRSVAVAAITGADECARAGRFDLANKFLAAATQAAGATKDTTLTKTISQHRTALSQDSRDFAAFQRAQATLAQKPDDPAACLAVGRYLCFIAQDWDAGLPLLSRGQNVDLKKLAGDALAAATDHAEFRRRGDAWWDRAQRANGVPRRDFERGARHWYSLAIAGLTGTDRTVTETRLAQLGGAPAVRPAPIVVAVASVPVAATSKSPLAASPASAPAPSATPSIPAAPLKPADANRAAAEEVLKLGGMVTVVVEGKEPLAVRPGEQLPSQPLTVKVIDLTKCRQVTDDTLVVFEPLSDLQRLVLDGTSVGDAGLTHLKDLTNLEELYLDDTKRITGSGFAALSQLTKLRELRLKRQQVTDAALVDLLPLKSLVSVRLIYNENLTDAALDNLLKLPALEYATMQGTKVTVAAAERVSKSRKNLRIKAE